MLEDFSVFTSNKMDSMASVVLSVCGERKKGNAIGIGAVDASYKAISSALGIPFKLSEYNLKAITGGTDALANVLIRIEGNKKEIQAESVHEDIALASVNALIKGMNKMKINELGQAK